MTTGLNENQQMNDDCEFIYMGSLNDLEKVTSGKVVLLEKNTEERHRRRVAKIE